MPKLAPLEYVKLNESAPNVVARHQVGVRL